MSTFALAQPYVTTFEESESSYPSASATTMTEEVNAFGLCSWQREAINKVIRLSELQENWDSYGTPPPCLNTINAAIDLIQILKIEDLPVPEVIPTADGGIQFEWDVMGKELEIEVTQHREIEYLKCQSGDPLEEGPVNGLVNIFTLFLWLYSS